MEVSYSEQQMAHDAATIGADVPDLATADYDSDIDNLNHRYHNTRKKQGGTKTVGQNSMEGPEHCWAF